MAEENMVVVASKVRNYLKSKDAKMSGDFPAALNKKVLALVEEASSRAKSNKRTTVKPQDV